MAQWPFLWSHVSICHNVFESRCPASRDSRAAVPKRQKRSIFVGFLRKDIYTSKDAAAWRYILKEMIANVQTETPKEMLDFLLPKDMQLGTLQALPPLSDGRPKSTASAGKTATDLEWQLHSAQLRETLGISVSSKIWTGKSSFKGWGLSLTDRVQDALDVTAAKILSRKVKNTSAHLLNTIIDVSQSITRGTCTKQSGVHPCFTTSSELYSYREDRLILAIEMLAILGYPREMIIPEDFTNRQLKRLVGNTISLPCLGMMFWSFQVMRRRDFEAPAEMGGT
ncbi:unnamed protein product [Symbiodinium necroappetens]|uniref:Uncharacterized protein n=1 Tax=Symbiodinium necroappetens TaxID=1628268 RepID=A0A812YR65_9DINO|nr:unnamed protein product [Symbiodinium necroappetens]